MAGENTNLAIRALNAGVDAALVTGAKAGQETSFSWQQVQAALFGAPGVGGVAYFDTFLGDAIDSRWQPAISNSGTIAINAQAGGAIRMTTDSANATDYATETLGLHWLVSRGWTIFRARVKQVTALTARKVEIGLSDAISESAGLAFSSHDATVVAVADDAAVFAIDTAESVTTWSALSVKAAGTPQRSAGLGTPATTYNEFAIAINSAGDAYFYIDGVLVATLLLAVATTAVLTPWITIANTATTAAVQDVDSVAIYGASA